MERIVSNTKARIGRTGDKMSDVDEKKIINNEEKLSKVTEIRKKTTNGNVGNEQCRGMRVKPTSQRACVASTKP